MEGLDLLEEPDTELPPPLLLEDQLLESSEDQWDLEELVTELDSLVELDMEPVLEPSADTLKD